MVSATIIKPNLSKSISKTRYTITSSSWSASPNADGYYTYSVSLSPQLNTSYAPNVYIAGSTDSTAPTSTEKGQYAYVERCRLAGSASLTLYAKTKPTSTFYIYVEGTNGSGSASIEGNVVKPNEVSGGEAYSTTETIIGTWKGQTLYRKVIEFGTLPDNTNKTVSTGYTLYAIKVVKACAICRNSYNANVILPFMSASGTAVINFRFQNNGGDLSVEIQTNFDATQYTECDVIMEYIKV